MTLSIVYLGNHLPTLRCLTGDGRVELRGVVVEAARATEAVRKFAGETAVRLETVPKKRDLAAAIDRLGPKDFLFVCSFGWILRRGHLDAARLGAVNIHYSFLPHYRGRHPINRALQHGASWTGITAHYVNEEIDAGPVISQARETIDPEDTDATLYRRLTERLPGVYDNAIARMIEAPGEGTVPEEAGSYYPPFDYESDGRVIWGAGAETVHNLIRSQTLFRGAHAGLRDTRIHFAASRIVDVPGHAADPGTILEASGSELLVAVEPGRAVRVRAREELPPLSNGLRLD